MASWTVQSLHVYKGLQQNQENHYIYDITMYLYLIASCVPVHFEYFTSKCIDKYHLLEVVK